MFLWGEFAYNCQALQKPANLENLRIVMVRTRNPLNIGAAARAMSNFGAFHLRLVTPFERAYREAVSAVGAAPLLATAEELESVPQAVRDCSLIVGTTAVGNRELRHDVCSLEAGAKKIRTHLGKGRAAILFGSEKTGLSNNDLSHCHLLLRIPTRVEHRSMNLAQAVAIVVYELTRGAVPHRAKNNLKTAPAEMEVLDRIHEALLESLYLSEYTSPRAAGNQEEKLSRMLRRIKMNAADAEVLLGMLRKIGWKLKQG
jgi:TrmH family RNA methyltransferase